MALGRTRQQRDDLIEQERDADELRGGCAQYGDQRPRLDAGVETTRHLVLRQRSGLQVFLDQRVLRLRGGFRQLLPGGLRGGRQLGRNLGGDKLAVSDGVGLHLQEIHDAAETCLGADRDLDGRDGVAKPRPQRLQRPIEAGVLTIEAVHNNQPADPAALRQRPGHFGLYLDAGHWIHDHDGALCRAQGRDHLADKIWIAGRVDQVDLVIPPL